MLKGIRFICVLMCAPLIMTTTTAQAYSHVPPQSIPAFLAKIMAAPALADPSMILIDESTGEVVFEKNADSLRKPASVLKIVSASAALKYLDSNLQYRTSINIGNSKNTIVINGQYDPWISYSYTGAKKQHRTSLPFLTTKSLQELQKINHKKSRHLTIKYSGLYSQDIANFRAFYAMRGVSTTIKQVTAQQALAASGEELVSGTSPTVATMLEWTLTWSDNLLAERFARLASRAAGNKFDDSGVAKTFTQMFNELGISDPKIQISDASGLSKNNRVSARTIANLLAKIRNESTYATVFKGLPVSGITGTLENRYITTAPQAVGLVHAKTGTLNGTMSLAGYVEAGDREYIFVTFADRIPKSTRAENLARITLDKAIAKLASPLVDISKSKAMMIETATAN